MVSEYWNAVGKAKARLAEYCKDGLRKLKEHGYDGTIEFGHEWIAGQSITEDPFFGSDRSYVYSNGIFCITYRTHEVPPSAKDPRTPEWYKSREEEPPNFQTRVDLKEIPFNEFQQDDLLILARKIEDILKLYSA